MPQPSGGPCRHAHEGRRAQRPENEVFLLTTGDLIRLQGLRLMGTHGALPEEQGRAQPFEVDCDLTVDLATSGRTDALTDTVHYGNVSVAIAKVVTGEQHRLLERLATRVADDVLAVDDRITSVTVTVRKLRPPLPVDLASAGVTITRRP